jgi:hypothetical protein
MCAQTWYRVLLWVITWLLLVPTGFSHAQLSEKESLRMQLRGLRQERIKTLQQHLQVLASVHREGRVDLDRLLTAQAALLDAKLDASEAPAERVKDLDAHCAVLKGALDIAESRFEAGVIQEAEVVQARAAYVRSQIRLLREQTPPTGQPNAPGKEEHAARVQQLQQELIKILQRAVEILSRQTEQGVCDTGRVTDAQAALTAAQLDAPHSKAERIALLTKQRADAEAFHALVQARFEVGAVHGIDVIQSRAASLEAQLRLIQEQAASEEPRETPDTVARLAQIRNVQQERIKTWQQAVDILDAFYREGRCELDRLLAAQVVLADAMPAATRSQRERMEILRTRCAAFKTSLDIAQARLAGGAVAGTDVAAARAAWLHAEIRLLEEQLGSNDDAGSTKR